MYRTVCIYLCCCSSVKNDSLYCMLARPSVIQLHTLKLKMTVEYFEYTYCIVYVHLSQIALWQLQSHYAVYKGLSANLCHIVL